MSAGGPDWLDFDPPRSTDRRSKLQSRVVIAVVTAVTLALVGNALYGKFRPAATAEKPPAVASSAPHPAPETSRSPTSAPPATRSRFVDRQLALPDAGQWVLFARDSDSVFRVQLDSGEVRRTNGISVDTSNSVSLLAGLEEVLVVTADTGSGTVVPDGLPARPIPRRLQQASQLFPGPPGLLWAQNRRDPGPGVITLVDFDGRRQGKPVFLGGAWPQPDGNGSLLFGDVGGVYELQDEALRRISTGTLTAAGQNHLLLAECDARHRCSSYLLDRDSGDRHQLGTVDTSSLPSGALSPDGRHVALVDWQGSSAPKLSVQDLRTGKRRRIEGLSANYGPDPLSTLAWAPDSRWLVMLLDSQISVLEVNSGRIRGSTTMRGLEQLVLRAPLPTR